jgi:uncharacterized membrane protein YgcG
MVVQCEGWARPGDTFVRAGSCALAYELHYTSPPEPLPQEHRLLEGPRHARNVNGASDFGDFLLGLFMLALAVIVPICLCAGCIVMCTNDTGPPSGTTSAYTPSTVHVHHHHSSSSSSSSGGWNWWPTNSYRSSSSRWSSSSGNRGGGGGSRKASGFARSAGSC